MQQICVYWIKIGKFVTCILRGSVLLDLRVCADAADKSAYSTI